MKVRSKPSTVLNSKSLSSFNQLRKLPNIKSVDLVKISDLDQLMNSDKSVKINLLKGRGKMTLEKQFLQFQKEQLVYQSSDLNDEVLIFKNKENTSAYIRRNGKVFDVQYLENGYAAMIEYDLKKIFQHKCSQDQLSVNGNKHESKKGKSLLNQNNINFQTWTLL